jgi:uncharacterized protein (TIGR02099 family)
MRRILSVVWYLCAALVVLSALAMSLARLALPLLEARAGQLEALVSATVGEDARIGRLEVAWRGLGPELQLHSLVLRDRDSGEELLTARELRINFSVPRSLLAWEPVPSRLVLLGSELSLFRDAEGRLSVQGIQLHARRANPWLLVLAQPHVELRDIRVHWRDALQRIPDLTVDDIDLRLRNRGSRHQLQVDLELPADYGGRLQVAADLSGPADQPFDWDGALYLAVERASLARWLANRLPADWTVDGLLDATVWARVDAGQFRRIEGALSLAGPRLANGGEQEQLFAADRLATRLDWRLTDADWTLQLADLHLDLPEGAWPETGASVRVEAPRDGARQVQVEVDYLRVEALLPLLLRLPGVAADQRSLLQQLQPGGELSDVRLAFGLRERRLEKLAYELRFQDLHHRAAGRLPGASGLSGRLAATPEHGSLDLDTRSAYLVFPALFRAPLLLDSAQGRIHWRRLADRLRIESARLELANADIRTRTRLRLDIPADASPPLLDLHAEFGAGRVEAVHKYLPAGIMPPRTVAWLDRALVSGSIPSGAFIYQGRFGDFPFDRATGRMEVRATVSDAVLDYREGWHRIEGLEAELAFVNRGMRIRGVTGHILGSEIREVDVRIDDLAHALLAIDGSAAGPLADMLRFLHDSPLGEGGPGAVLGDVQASGDAALALGLRIPLKGGGQTEVEGRVTLAGNGLALPAWDIAFEAVEGALGFTHDSVQAPALRARMYGVPVAVAVSDARLERQPATRVRVTGALPLVQRLRQAGGALARYVDGDGEWAATLDLPRDGGGAPARLELASDLRGIAVNLPEPLGKTAEAAREFRVRADIRSGGLGQLALDYGEHSAALALERREGEQRLVRAEIRLGAADARLPETPGARVVGRLSTFAWDAWREVLGGAGVPQAGGLALLDVEIDALHAFGRDFSAVRIQAERVDDRGGPWHVRLGGPDVDGVLDLPAQADGPLRLRFERLRIPPAGAAAAAETRLDPASVPPLDMTVQRLHFRDLDLGRVVLKTHPVGNGLAVDVLDVEADWLRLGARGEWTRHAGKDASRFRIDLKGGELGGLLEKFGYAGSIQGGETRGEIDANWPGMPTDFALAKLEGGMSFQIGKGRLLQVEAGAGRVFGLFNLQGLRRRLALDFSDVFAKGFSFDRIEGKFALMDGDAYTNDLTVEGPAARIEISGRTGLARQDYDQLVTVIPHIQSTIPIAGALAGGPVVGAALLLADKLFARQMEELTSFARYQYTVTGSWDDPQVKQLPREPARGLQSESSTTPPSGTGNQD